MKNIPVNIAITGESGSGKSTFVNAVRGMKNRDTGAAPTGCVETTIEVKDYPHPNYYNVKLWDLPGIGTTKFPAAKYLQYVGFEKYDFFIIISADRFRENDVKLAKEIQKMGKKFYFVCSMIDLNLRDDFNFNAERTLALIRENCIQGLREQGFPSPQVFLLASPKFQLYDFPLLHKTLEREFPEHKRDAVLFAMNNISLPIIKKKKKAFQAQVKGIAWASACYAAIPCAVFCLELKKMRSVATQYVEGFGLDRKSLTDLANCARVRLMALKGVTKSPLVAANIDDYLVSREFVDPVGMYIYAMLGLFPTCGTAVAMTETYKTTKNVLNSVLNTLAEDAQRVFQRALHGLKTIG